MEQNDISVRPSKQEIMFGDDYIFSYSGSGRSVCGMVTGHEPIELDTESVNTMNWCRIVISLPWY